MPENRQSCFRCGTSNDADALVCKRCGGSLTSPPPAPGNMGGGRATEQDTEPFLPGPLQVGDIFHNRYKVVKLLGSGGMGMVYQVHDPMTRTEYALKLIRPELLNSERAVERFKKEFRNSEKLHHPHIIRVKHLDQAEIAGEKRYYMVLELVGGGDLRRRLEEARAAGRVALSEGDIRRWMREICAALEYAHGLGVIHRDLSPDNVLLREDGAAVVTDFGVARALEGSDFTHTNQSLGKALYMAPEQQNDAKNADHRADIFSLGRIFYEFCTGELHAGELEPIHESRPDLPAGWHEVYRKATRRDPAQRFASAGEFHRALARPESPVAQAPAPSPASLPAPEPAPSPPLAAAGMVAWWRRPVVFAAGGLLLAALGYMAAAWKKPAPISPDVPDQAVAAAPPPAAAGSVASSSPADASAVVDSAARDQTKQAPVPIPPPTRAHLWYTACKGGDQNACGRLSDCVYIGRQCGEGKLASTLDAECKQGISAACAVLGMCYEHGECGLKKDPTRAGILYGEACEGGDMPSCSRLGRCYLHGRCGLEKNRERARLYYDQACRGGDSDACKLLKALGN